MTKFLNKVDEQRDYFEDEGVAFQWHLVVPLISEPQKINNMTRATERIAHLNKQLIAREDEIIELKSQIEEMQDKAMMEELVNE